MTFDIYTNRIPLGLLTDEEKAALQAHKGKFEATPSHAPNWIECTPSWVTSVIYRAVPEPLRPADPPWHALNDQIQYIARNEDGAICGYSGKPIRGEKQWLEGGYRFWGLSSIVKFDHGNMPWDKSLVIRPGVSK